MTAPTVRGPVAASPARTTPLAPGMTSPGVTGPAPRGRIAPPRSEARARFVAALARGACPSKADPLSAPIERRPAKPTIVDLSAGESQRRKEARRSHDARRDPEPDPSELAAFRPLPRVLQAPPPPVTPAPPPRTDLARLAEQLVTRLRVGRCREGATVELRLALGDRELDVRLVETVQGLELHTDGDDALRDAIARELLARGLPLAP